MHTLKVGDAKLVILEDGTWKFPAKAFFSNAPETAWRERVGADADGKIPVGHNCALISADDALIVVDTGYGADTHGGCTGHLGEELARAGCAPADVTHVVNTHAHGDHIKGNTVARDGRREPRFPRARYVLGRGDWERFNGPAGRVHEFDRHLALLDRLGMLALVEGGIQLTPHVRLQPTPGHTPGHTSVVVESRGETAIFLGDLCHHALHFEQPDWVSELDVDPGLTPRTRAALFGFAAARAALVICPHAPAPGVGRVVREADTYRWRPAA